LGWRGFSISGAYCFAGTGLVELPAEGTVAFDVVFFFTIFVWRLMVFVLAARVLEPSGVRAGACAKVRDMEASAKAMIEAVVFILFSPAGLAARSHL
jgi:hypothetical protein